MEFNIESISAALVLARRSRCFSRGWKALHHAVKLFVYAWNRRQLYKQDYPAHIKDFVYF